MGRISQIDDCDLDEERPPTVLEIIASVNGLGAREIVQELWGAGYTITKRRSGDPFEFDRKIIPVGMTYEWRAKSVLSETPHYKFQEMDFDGWHAVPASRHDGVFMPCGYEGDIEYGRQMLMETEKTRADASDAQRTAKAHQNVDDWVQKYGGQFSGGVRVWTGDVDAPAPSEWRNVGVSELAEKVIAHDIESIPGPKPQPSWFRRMVNFLKEQW